MLHTVGKSFPAISLQNPTKTLSYLFNFTTTLNLITQLHAQIILNGFHQSVLFNYKISNAYLDMGSLDNAFKAFNEIPFNFKNPYSWNRIIAEYSKRRRFYDVLKLFKQFLSENFAVDSFNLVFAIKACIGLSVLQKGKSFHSLAVKSGLKVDPYVGPALLNLYVELCDSLEESQKLFDEIPLRNLVIWGAMMKGYLKFSQNFEVFELFDKMRKSGFKLDPYTMDGLVRACGNVCAGKVGISLHGYCLKRNFTSSNIYLHTSILDMYMKCGLVDFAIELFEDIEDKDVILWSTIISGFVKNGRACEAISLFRKMLDESIIPNEITFSSVLLACSHLGALELGKSVHGYTIRNEIALDVVSYNSLIDMYAKCGDIGSSSRVFNKMPERNVFSWSVMINGFGIHGLYSEALSAFNLMRTEKHLPNSVTFVSILSACSHSGRVKEGLDFFDLMFRDYGIIPIEEHYACLVDLLGRAGRIEEATSLIETMPMNPGASILGALLSACRIHKRADLAEKIAEKLIVMEPDKSSVYVLLSNIYASVGKWEMVKKVRRTMGLEKLQKIIAFSSVEIDMEVFVFGAKDRLTHKKMEIEGVLILLLDQMRELGYMPDNRVVHDFDD